ncbi:hypothetical protein [Undibacterium sp. Tian12W]|uniref:hypothetical protein n=1 Tax=Undibacterium sp. Tian12W TaxID=3413054 RepID=UPI003BF11AA9
MISLSKLFLTQCSACVPGLFALCLALLPMLAHASQVVSISEAKEENVQFDLSTDGVEPVCTGRNGQVFNPALGIRKLSDTSYLKALNSEAPDGAQYLKAARMGGGIYIYLPFFFPARECKDVVFEVNARHILWGDKWHSGSMRLGSEDARGKAIFFTNEETPVVQGSSYFDQSIPAPTLARLQTAFEKILKFYQDVLKVYPQNNIGVVTAVVRNQGNYSGYGGDSLNIIRMSYDNPTPAQLLTMDELIASTFAHELAHKLQRDGLYKLPLARYIVEGQADFFKIIVLHNSGLIDEVTAKQRILKSASDCAKFADSRTMREKVEQKSIDFKEPYDCGMAYYFVAYYSSELQAADFMEALRKAMLGENSYGGQENKLCLLFETTCANERMKGIAGDKISYLQQIQWLESMLAKRPLPKLNR